MLAVHGPLGNQRVRNLFHQHGPARPERNHICVILSGRIRPSEFARELQLFRIAMLHDRALQVTVRVDQIDRTPVGKEGNRKLGDCRKRRFVLERRGKHLAGLGQKLSPSLCRFSRRAQIAFEIVQLGRAKRRGNELSERRRDANRFLRKLVRGTIVEYERSRDSAKDPQRHHQHGANPLAFVDRRAGTGHR